jgi:ABC-2 type transport system permease protein
MFGDKLPPGGNMAQFLGFFRHEFNMSIRRPGLWIAYILLFAFYSILWFTPSSGDELETISRANLWQYAGRFMLMFNLFLPLVGGILAADRMQRDFRLGVRELQDSAPFHRWVYILGKYFGVLYSLLVPVFLWIVGFTVAMILTGNAPPEMLYGLPVAFLAMTVPAFAFVTAFSLACPLIMPLRVYQILFTGYWFWGNFLNPEAFPTISETYLEAAGKHVYEGFFGGYPVSMNLPLQYNSMDASLNLLVLTVCVIAVLFVLNRYLRWQSQHA